MLAPVCGDFLKEMTLNFTSPTCLKYLILRVWLPELVYFCNVLLRTEGKVVPWLVTLFFFLTGPKFDLNLTLSGSLLRNHNLLPTHQNVFWPTLYPTLLIAKSPTETERIFRWVESVRYSLRSKQFELFITFFKLWADACDGWICEWCVCSSHHMELWEPEPHTVAVSKYLPVGQITDSNITPSIFQHKNRKFVHVRLTLAASLSSTYLPV